MMTDTLNLNERARREIRAELGRQNLSQRQLAERLGWSRMYLSHRLSGKVALTLADLERIADELGVPIAQFTNQDLGRGDES